MEWWSNGVVEWWNNELSPGTQKGCNTLRVERTKRLEGSRFVAWQLYGLVAGGSRERLEVWQFYGPFYPPPGRKRWAKHSVG
jgi:hypothetical protein